MGILVNTRIGLAQINTTVGDLPANADRLIEACQALEQDGAGIILTPELAVTGYPPQDLLFKDGFVRDALHELERIHEAVGRSAWIIGCVRPNDSGRGKPFHNAAAVLEKGQPIRWRDKCLLPTYDVFNETRYFEPGSRPEVIELRGQRWGITICEDIWTPDYLPGVLYELDPAAVLVSQGACAILNLSASPFQTGKPLQREEMVREAARRHKVPFHYCNAVGGNDQLVFDGHSFAVDAEGTVTTRLAGFAEQTGINGVESLSSTLEEELRQALVLGVRDYAKKCGFRSAVLGLSGGIDSALVACIAVEALGAPHVHAVAMPSPFSSDHSLEDALLLARRLGIRCDILPISEPFEVMLRQLKPFFEERPSDSTEENVQARLRGLSLMALSNKLGHLLLTTGNKSELAVGYCTLYGDMCGGLAVISDVPKTMVYRLATHWNATREIIPARTISKAPSAELRPDQKDQDSLPPYDLLDQILHFYVERNESPDTIVARGFSPELVRWIAAKVDSNEYKREQAAPGLKVTSRAFGIGRRMPIAQRYKPAP